MNDYPSGNGAVPVKNNVYRMEPTHKTVNERLRERLGERDEQIRALINNEAINRRRLDALEPALKDAGLILSRPFLGRAKWLLTGK